MDRMTEHHKAMRELTGLKESAPLPGVDAAVTRLQFVISTLRNQSATMEDELVGLVDGFTATLEKRIKPSDPKLKAVAGGAQTTYKALPQPATPASETPLDDALDALEEFIEEVETDENEQAIADQVNALLAQIQAQVNGTPPKVQTKLTDNGPGSVHHKSTQVPETMMAWLTGGKVQ